MPKKVNKQVVSTHAQCLAHCIFLEICIPKSLIVNLAHLSTANHLSQHACN